MDAFRHVSRSNDGAAVARIAELEARLAKAEEALAELAPWRELMRATRERLGVTTAEVQAALRAA
jgi:uncharacterized coiled-coil protein SlyX